jgi:hypothetical protein
MVAHPEKLSVFPLHTILGTLIADASTISALVAATERGATERNIWQIVWRICVCVCLCVRVCEAGHVCNKMLM